MKKIYSLILFLSLTLCTKAQMVSINTDVLMDALMIPNIGGELTIGEHSTLGLNVMGTSKSWGMDIKAWAIQPEYRHYFSTRPMNKLFVGICGLGTTYDFTIRGKRCDGYAVGAGLSFGYVLPLTERLNVDFHAGLGVVRYTHKESWEGDHYDSNHLDEELITEPNAKGLFAMPTRFGVSIQYILK